MSDRSKSVVVIYRAKYGKVSFYGNPSLVLETSRGTLHTLANAGFVYGVDPRNLTNVKAELSLTPSGRVTNIRVLRGSLKDVVSDYGHVA